jgi:hypothetical protein
MEQENARSKIIWKSMQDIMKVEGENIMFSEVPEGYKITPIHIRWKNFFIYNSYWPHIYPGGTQTNMITFSDKMKEIANSINTETMDIQNYVDVLTHTVFSIYLTDSEKNRKALQKRLINENYIIITQNVDGRIEEFITTIAAKLFFMKNGFLVGDFAIPSEYEISYGIPDIVGMKGGFVNYLKGKDFSINGLDVSDLLIWSYLIKISTRVNESLEIIDCEVKSSKDWNQGFKQLYDNHGYLKSGCFDKAYVCFGTQRKVEWHKPDSQHEAGSLIFTDSPEPIVFQEDTILCNPSSIRRKNSVKAKQNRKSEMMDLANQRVARLIMGDLSMPKIILNIGDCKVNQFFKKIKDTRVENVIDMITKPIKCE